MPRRFCTGALALVSLLIASLAGCTVSQEEYTTPLRPLPGITLLTRAEWDARPPAGAMQRHTPRALTIHHTATPQRPDRDPRETLRALQRFSFSDETLADGTPKRAWPDVPYHYYIAPDGTVVEGRDVRFEGDTNTEYDTSGQVQIAVEGDFTEQEPTEAQVLSLIRLAASLSEAYGIPTSRVAGHRDRAVGQTLCPGNALEAHLPEVRAAMRRE